MFIIGNDFFATSMFEVMIEKNACNNKNNRGKYKQFL